MKRFLTVFLCLLASAAFSAEREKLAEEYLLAKGTPELLENTISGMVDKQIKENPALAPYRLMVLEYCRKSLSFEAHKKELIALYAGRFTAEELRELIRIANSPLGRKLAAFDRDLALKLGEWNNRKLAENLPEFQKKLENAAQK